MSDRIYCYSNSDVLINNLNIYDAIKLYEAEQKLSMLRLMNHSIHHIFYAFTLPVPGAAASTGWCG